MDKNDELIELLKAQRKFLHDIASPLMIAGGMIETAERVMTDTPNETVSQKLDKAKNAIKKATTLLQENRKLLISLSEDK